jgi:hypothetical protein
MMDQQDITGPEVRAKSNEELIDELIHHLQMDNYIIAEKLRDESLERMERAK